MTEFLHKVVEKREREQEHRNYSPDNYLRELQRQMTESYNRMTSQTIDASYAADPIRVTEDITQVHGMIYVRTRSLSSVDAYIRANVESHSETFSRDSGLHSHGIAVQRWILESVSGLYGLAQFDYRCSVCGSGLIATERVRRMELGNAGLAV